MSWTECNRCKKKINFVKDGGRFIPVERHTCNQTPQAVKKPEGEWKKNYCKSRFKRGMD
jgi:hypothetical protein